MNKSELKRRIIETGGARCIAHWWMRDGEWHRTRVNDTSWRVVDALRSDGLVLGGSILDLNWSAEVKYDYDGPYRFMITWHHRNGDAYARREYTLNMEEEV